eukprot:CAMPEP_0184681372 /NCGR_PEP_ID=MMETSP0312-20130426/4328_1 /TAXON_ID=31354 /ORGANISM="Compsopogon coeruleus, Strain SAG 36.94" /LENGTH=313 /DNA_ID=CAMNT_0027132157 /DNA_START=21 /DNA_END=962 /DNA_ORIENTATION=+
MAGVMKMGIMDEVIDMWSRAVVVLNEARGNMVAGAVARASAILMFYPFDTLKTRLQVSGPVGSRAKSLIFKLDRTLFGGVVAAVLGQVPFGAVTFAAYEVYKEKLAEAKPKWDERWRVIFAACLGDLTGSLLLVPSEVVKVRVQTREFPNVLQSAKGIFFEGGLMGYYHGFVSQALRDLPFRALQLALYEQGRHLYKERFAPKRELSTFDSFVVGGAAGTATALVTTPLDVIKTRIMAQRCGSGAVYSNVFDAMVKTVKGGGVGALMKGVVPRVLVVAPSTAIFFMIYETTLWFLKRRNISFAKFPVQRRQRS